jgi:hypothetical protein
MKKTHLALLSRKVLLGERGLGDGAEDSHIEIMRLNQ